MTPRVAVNLLTCNSRNAPHHLRAAQYAVRSLLDSDLQQCDWRLQIVDNGSDCPATHDWLDEIEKHQRIGVYRSKENIGLAKGRNAAWERLAEYEPEYGLEIHTDHIFPSRWLGALIAWAGRHPRIGMCGSALVTQGHAWGSPKLELSYDWPYERCRNEVEKATRRRCQAKRMNEGLSHPALYPWRTLEEMDFYDGDMPGLQELEDTELAYRLTRAGWLVVIYHGSYVYHHYHLTRLVVSDWATAYNANNLYCQKKHGPEFVEFMTATVQQWMEKVYRR